MSAPVLRGNIWYFRKRVPLDLIAIVDCWVVVKSLRTRHKYLAMIRTGQLLHMLNIIFSFIRMNDHLDTTTLKTIFHKLLKISLGMIERDDGGFAAPVPHDPAESVADIEEAMKNDDDELYYLGRMIISEIPELKQYEDQLEPGQIRQIGLLRLRTSREHLKQMMCLRSEGRFTEAYDDYFEEVFTSAPILPESRAYAPVSQPNSEETGQKQASKPNLTNSADLANHHVGNLDVESSLIAVYAAFAAEMGKNWGKRRYKFEEAKQLLCDMFGAHTNIRSLTPHHVRQVKEAIQRLPVRANNKAQYKGLTIVERIAKAEQDDDERITAKTANDKLGNISLWFKWAKDNLYIEKNLFEGVSIKATKTRGETRTSFTDSQLQTIFSSYVYTGMKSERQWYEAGDVISKNNRYWIPLIAIHTGMRLEEICQLKLNTITQINNIWCFDLRDKELNIKTEAGARVIPVHQNLWNGWQFQQWIKQQAINHAPEDRLFGELTLNNYGQYGGSFSKWFARFLKHLDVKTKQLVFHSFRHGFADLLRDTGVEYQIMQTLLGHAANDVTSQYGKGYSVKVLNEALQKVQIPFDRPKI